ncbi:MAG: DUF6599 family protein [Candidatus Sulfotelmatobacter sp.]
MIVEITKTHVLLVSTLCVVMFAAAACSRPARVQVSPFPASNEVVGWAKNGDIRTFSATELWNYIDGDAERYVKAGVQTTSTADYNFQNQFDAVVDVYTMSSAAGARTILESEQGSGAKSVQIGDRARLYAGSLVFCKGSHLVRIVAYKQSPEVATALQDLGREIERHLAE